MGYCYLQRMPGIKDEKEGNELLRTVREHFMLAAINGEVSLFLLTLMCP